MVDSKVKSEVKTYFFVVSILIIIMSLYFYAVPTFDNRVVWFMSIIYVGLISALTYLIIKSYNKHKKNII